MRFVVVVFLFFWSWFSEEKQVLSLEVMPEICDNGIDDDMDGLIDLNDTTDCVCNGLENIVFRPSSLIPNPSFEDTVCCPGDLASLHCAADWIQASSATSDYFHTCGFAYNEERGSPPQPLPAGDGYIGFLDVRGFFQPYKEYVGACLNEEMEIGKEYTLQFYLGFGRAGTVYTSRSPMEIVLYGTNDCGQLPFGDNRYQECPSLLPEWFEIASVQLQGSNEWVRATMRFTPTSEVAAVALGPGCSPARGSYYYFMDDLVLNESDFFKNVPLSMEGDICDDQVTLSAQVTQGLNYQWYRNGIAVIGATDDSLVVAKTDTGRYVLRIDDGQDCQLTDEFDYYPQDFVTQIDTTLCMGEIALLEGQSFSSSAKDTFYYSSSNYCDSLVIVNVSMLDTSATRLDTTICDGQNIEVGNEIFSSTGVHRVTLSNSNGCDSLVVINLTIQDTVLLNRDTSVCAGEVVEFLGRTMSEAGEYEFTYSNARNCNVKLNYRISHLDTFQFIRDTSICEGVSLIPGGEVIVSPGTYPYTFASQAGCDSTVMYRTSLHQVYDLMIDTSICQGETVVLEGEEISSAGVYPFNMISSTGCDSTRTYRVQLIEDYFEEMDTFICPGDALIIWNDTMMTEGVYQVNKGLGNCDSTLEVTLAYHKDYDLNLDTLVCANTGFQFEDSVYTRSTTIQKRYSTINGCDSNLTIELLVAQEPEVAWDIFEEIPCFGELSGDIRLALDSTLNQVVWDDGTRGAQRSNLEVGVYPFTINYGGNCSVRDSLVLDQPQPLQWNYQSQDASCDGLRGGRIDIVESVGGVGIHRLFINDEEVRDGQMSKSNLEPGLYSVMVMDENGCTIREEVQINQVLPGTVRLSVTDSVVLIGQEVDLSIQWDDIDSLVSVQWYGPEGDCSDCLNWTVTPGEGSNTYTVFIEDGNGCIYELRTVIRATSQTYIPNAFSPNGDGVNDFFYVYDDGSLSEVHLLEVYNRWGELMFQGRNLTPGAEELGWDGQFRGQIMNPGVYVYRVEVIDQLGHKRTYSGDLTLVR